jgi:hypothetical protein
LPQNVKIKERRSKAFGSNRGTRPVKDYLFAPFLFTLHASIFCSAHVSLNGDRYTSFTVDNHPKKIPCRHMIRSRIIMDAGHFNLPGTVLI